MRDRLYIAAASSTTAARHSSSRGPVGGRGRWRRGFCDGRGDGAALVGGDEHLRTVRQENYVHRVGWRGDAGGSGATPAAAAPPQPSSFRIQAPPYHPISRPRGLWRPVQGAATTPRQPWQRPPPADFRNWMCCSSSSPPPPAETGRFTVLSYNILADYLAQDHRSKLYFHIPPEILDWEWRKSRLLIEFGLWSADIMCLQEVDRFQELEEELTRRGYTGVWKMRTGNAVDGCAVFWRACRFVLRHEEHIEFSKLGLRDNVAQICVLESKNQSPGYLETSSSRSRRSPGTDCVVVCNIHVLFNPKRGEIKLGQVRTLLNQAYSVSKMWDDAPVIVCGDFNCTPKSPLYNFISEQKLDLSGLARSQVSGQHSPIFYPPRLFPRGTETKMNYSNKGCADNAFLGDKDEIGACSGSISTSGTEMNRSDESITINMLRSSKILISEEREELIGASGDASELTKRLSFVEMNEELSMSITFPEEAGNSSEKRNSYSYCSNELGNSDVHDDQAVPLEAGSCDVDDGEDEDPDPNFLEELHRPADMRETVEEPSTMPFPYPDPYLWTPMEIAVASGDQERTILEHSLKLTSAYTEMEDCAGTKDSNGEPMVTSYNRQFMGTVDYIWHSEGLQTIKALDTIPPNVLRRTSGFPTRKWGSDHIALVCEFAFKKT